MTKDKIGKIFSQYFNYKWFENSKQDWISIQNSTDILVPVDYSYDEIRYQNRYFSDIRDEYIECSACLYNTEGKPFAIFPLCIYKEHKSTQYNISAWGNVLFEPIIISGYNKKVKRRIYSDCLKVVYEICNMFNISDVVFQTMELNGCSSLFQMILMEHGGRVEDVTFDCVLELEANELLVFDKLRTTYRRYIRKTENMWRSVIVDNNSSIEEIRSVMTSFRNLHIEVAGRETRNIETWKLQEEAVVSGDSMVVLLYDAYDNLIGASLYSATSTTACYGVGAFKRELFSKPVSHLSQWCAIQYYIKKGVKVYNIGWRAYPGDKIRPTEKEIEIGYFKEGFASKLIMKPKTKIEIG